MDVTIAPYDRIPDYDPVDIEQAIDGYGPIELQEDVKRYLKKNISKRTLIRLLGITDQDLKGLDGYYGKAHVQSVIILKPFAEADLDQLHYQSGRI